MSTRGIFPGMCHDNGSLTLDFPSKAHEFNRHHFAGHEVTIEVYKRRSKRSLKQNAFLHAAIEPWATHIGETVTGLKIMLLGEVFGWTTIHGHAVPTKDHTSELNTEEFSDVMAYAMQAAAEDGVLILDPSQYIAEKRKREKKAAKAA